MIALNACRVVTATPQRERVIIKLHTEPCPNKNAVCLSQGEILDITRDKFKFKAFQQKLEPIDKTYRWNAQDAMNGKSCLWHEKYSLSYTKNLGFVACQVTSKYLGIGPCERSWGWGDVKTIKTAKDLTCRVMLLRRDPYSTVQLWLMRQESRGNIKRT